MYVDTMTQINKYWETLQYKFENSTPILIIYDITNTKIIRSQIQPLKNVFAIINFSWNASLVVKI